MQFNHFQRISFRSAQDPNLQNDIHVFHIKIHSLRNFIILIKEINTDIRTLIVKLSTSK